MLTSNSFLIIIINKKGTKQRIKGSGYVILKDNIAIYCLGITLYKHQDYKPLSRYMPYTC